MTRAQVQQQARADARAAAAWYERQQPGLGVEFILELDAAIDRAGENPDLYQIQYRGVRRVLLRRFPYAVYFIFEQGVVEVFAVLHQHRDSSQWQGRTPE